MSWRISSDPATAMRKGFSMSRNHPGSKSRRMAKGSSGEKAASKEAGARPREATSVAVLGSDATDQTVTATWSRGT